jgi:hypothetical protein
MAFTNSILRFTINVDKPTNKITFTDVTDYIYWYADKQASGLLKITDPIGNVIHENVGYSTDNYEQPDIMMMNDLRTSVTDILMQVVSGDIIPGDYVIDYKLTHFALGAPLVKAVVATAATRTFVFSGMSPTEEEKFCRYGWFGIDDGLNAGDYTIASFSYSAGSSELTVVVDQAIIDESASIRIWPENAAQVEVFSIQKTLKYCYISTEIEIGYDLTCSQSKLISSDNTNYTVLNDTDTLSTYNLTRVHSVSAPAGSGFGTIADNSDAARTFVNIWTNIWQTSIESTIVYDVVEWVDNEAQSDEVLYTISDYITGSDSIDVQCESCSCDIIQPITNLYNEWIASKGSCSTSDANELEDKLLQVTVLYSQVLQANFMLG